LSDTISIVAARIAAIRPGHPVRVSVDGRTAAGKTTFGDHLADTLRERTDREIIRVGLDFFKKARHLRSRFAQQTAESYYLDSWDYPAIIERLLAPLGPGGDRRYTTRIMNLMATEPIDDPVREASADAIVIIDGAFAQRPELTGRWDLVIWLDIDEATSKSRGMARDAATIGPLTEQQYRTKYLPGEKRYIDEERPAERADIVIDHRELGQPRIVRIGR
jgi:uridine kinase